MSHVAIETRSLEWALAELPESQKWIASILRRLEPQLGSEKLRVLEIGAAQGRALVALARLGHEACGVEPWAAAIEVAHELAQAEGVAIQIEEGRAEAIPFEDNRFDLVVATSVMEHVPELDKGLREIYRVLRPGGLIWFNIASSVCPFQDEITGFPLFGWYPNPIKLAIMRWATEKRPHLVGHTTAPAVNWTTPKKMKRHLREIGFSDIRDRWSLRLEDEDSGMSARFIALAKRYPAARLIGDMLRTGLGFTARK